MRVTLNAKYDGKTATHLVQIWPLALGSVGLGGARVTSGWMFRITGEHKLHGRGRLTHKYRRMSADSMVDLKQVLAQRGLNQGKASVTFMVPFPYIVAMPQK